MRMASFLLTVDNFENKWFIHGPPRWAEAIVI